MKPAQALVYRYTFWDRQYQTMRESEDFATLPAIHSGLGMPIHRTEMSVDADQVQDGIYRPRIPSFPTMKLRPEKSAE